MNLSPHFTLEELTASSTALRLGKVNNPEPDCIETLQALAVNVLEPMRTRLNRPIVVESGHRAPWLNALVGGQPNSQHMTDMVLGAAADVKPLDMDLFTAAKLVTAPDVDEVIAPFVDFDQLILERYTPGTRVGWLHVSWRPMGRRREILTITTDGKTIKGLRP